MTDATGSVEDVATYLVGMWRAECRRRGDVERPWPDALSMGVARALTEELADPDRQVIELELRATTFLGAGPRVLSAWRLGVLDQVLRDGGSEYGLAAIAHLFAGEPGTPTQPEAPAVPEPDATAAQPEAPAVPEPDATAAQQPETPALPEEPSVEMNLAGTDAEPFADDLPGGRRGLPEPQPAAPDEVATPQSFAEASTSAAPPPFWARVDATSAAARLPGEPSPSTELEDTASSDGAPGISGTPWPDELEVVAVPREAEHPTASAPRSGTKEGADLGAAQAPASSPSVPRAAGESQASITSSPAGGVSVSDRATFETHVCRLVDEKVELSVTFVGLDEVPGASLGVPDATDVTATEDSAFRDLLRSLARRFADRGTCYDIGRGLAAVVVERGRPKEVDRLVRKLPSSEVPASFSWGSARFPDEATDVRELLRMALVRLANMREERLTPRILVDRIRRVVSARG
ncbi:MAG: hypothetical protein M0Z82_01535 [Actinomycetota bacterium]|nr:hypothetical protein [Actinomycetota bacterium]